MALVKCSVFNDQQQQQQTQPAPVMGRHLVNGGSSGGLASLTGAAFNRPKAGECTIRRNSQNYGPAAGEQYFECANIGPNSKPEVSPTLVKWLDGRQRLGGGTESPLNESAELHQLMRAALDDVDPVGGSQDGQRQQHNNNWELAAIQGRTTGGGGSPPPLAQLTAINDANWQQCQRQDRHGQGSRSLLAPDNDKPRILRALGDNKHEAHDEASRPSFVATSASQQQQSRQKCSNGSKNKPLDIMGHFLVTLGGTLSAHDSIQGLQALVEPFTSVRNQDQLAASLDHVLALTSNGIDSCRLWASYGHRNTIHDHSQPLNQPPSTNTQRHQAGAVQANTIHHDQENLATGFGKEEEPIQPLAIGERADHRHHHHQTTPSSAALCGGGGGQLNKSHDQANGGGSAGARKYPPVALMNKRQLVGALNFVFLGELKQNLVERLHEFTDCAYTKHEHRETILSLLTSIKFILNKFVKLIYRLRRRIASPSEPNQLSNLRQFARQLGDFCGQLSYELQMAAIELADELDRLNGELELTKQMKHLCLVGDTTKARLVFDQFCEQSEQLVEICRMLNQIAPTNKLKITTKSLANWFQLNYRQLVAFADCLSENPISKTAKDCVWTYIQVWSSFYDDFGQLSRQLAYLAHSKSDPRRAGRVSNLRDQIDSARVNYIMRLPPLDDHLGQDTNQRRQQQQLMLADGPYQQQQANSDEGRHQQRRRCSQNEPELEFEWAERPGDWPRSPLQSIGSLQSLGHNQQFAFEMTGQPSNDSPRSLDHYHGFGPNYRRWHEGQPAAGGCPNSECSPVSPVSKFVIDNQQQQLLGSGACEPCAAGGGYSSASSRQQQVASCDSSLSSLAATERQYLMGTVTPLSQIEAMTQQHWAMVAQENEPSLALAQTTPAVPSSLMGTVTPSYSSPFGSSMTPLAPTSIRVDPLAPPIEPPSVPARRSTTSAISGTTMNAGTTSTGGDLATSNRPLTSALERPAASSLVEERRRRQQRPGSGGSSGGHQYPVSVGGGGHNSRRTAANIQRRATGRTTLGSSIGREDQVREEDEENYEERAVAEAEADSRIETTAATARCLDSGANVVLPPGGDQNSIASSTLDCAQTGSDKWSDSEADAIVRGARETAQMALSMYQFTRGEGDLNTTQDLFTQAELFAEEANELYKEVRCFSYKVPAGDLKKELLFQLSTIPALVQQLQFTVKNPTVGKAATFAKVDSVIRETKSLMEAVNRVVEATLSCRQHYNMASASLRKRTRTLSPAYRGDKFEFEPFGSPGGGRGLGGAFGGSGGGGGRHASSASGGMGSEPDI